MKIGDLVRHNNPSMSEFGLGIIIKKDSQFIQKRGFKYPLPEKLTVWWFNGCIQHSDREWAFEKVQ